MEQYTARYLHTQFKAKLNTSLQPSPSSLTRPSLQTLGGGVTAATPATCNNNTICQISAFPRPDTRYIQQQQHYLPTATFPGIPDEHRSNRKLKCFSFLSWKQILILLSEFV